MRVFVLVSVYTLAVLTISNLFTAPWRHDQATTTALYTSQQHYLDGANRGGAALIIDEGGRDARTRRPAIDLQRPGKEPMWQLIDIWIHPGSHATIQERGYHFYPFDDMFRPFEPSHTRFKSLVLFTAGRSGMENVDALITAWGPHNFDYAIMHFDDSSAEWSRFDWYKHVVSITAQRQAKLWFYKRFASPWLVKGYRYVHFVDSDAGSPTERPFDLAAYEALLDEYNVMIGQPATSHGGRSSDHPISRVHEGNLLRWTSFVENGPLFSVAQRAYECVWGTINGDFVSGWGVDFGWCQYAAQVCGYPERRTCAVVDAHYIVHLDKRTASAQLYHNLTYEDHGRREFDLYRERFASMGVKGFKSFDIYETAVSGFQAAQKAKKK